MRDQRVGEKIEFILLVGGGLFVVTFLGIFIPMLIHDMHVAPHDGQGGIGGFVIGIPMAFAVSILGTSMAWQWAAKRGWFTEPPEDGDGGRTADQ